MTDETTQIKTIPIGKTMWGVDVNENFSFLWKQISQGQPLNAVKSPATMLNGSTAGYSSITWTPYNDGKLVYLHIDHIKLPASAQNTDTFTIPAELAPDHWVNAAASERAMAQHQGNGQWTIYTIDSDTKGTLFNLGVDITYFIENK